MKLDLIRLGEQLSEENNAAHDLWTWLPSHAVAKKHHGDYAAEHCPSNRDVMIEAALYLAHLRHNDKALSVNEKEWFTRCPCDKDHDCSESSDA